jgi:hypothetical protein
MVRKVLTPKKREISIELPKEFVGKKVEVIAFTIDELKEDLSDLTQTHLASEMTLAKEWLTPEEDEAWKDL